MATSFCPRPVPLRKQRGFRQVCDEVEGPGAAQGGAPGFRPDYFAFRYFSLSVENRHRHNHFLDWRNAVRKQSSAKSQKLVGRGLDRATTAVTTIPTPRERHDYIPINFVPRQNPFYCALPYNDVSHGQFKPEAPMVVPWFRQAFVQQGHSVCKDRWIAIRRGNRVCYAQWEDCGPFRTDHYQYVFRNERPRHEPQPRRGPRCLAGGSRLFGTRSQRP